jgi:arginyl-tRNA synthetase
MLESLKRDLLAALHKAITDRFGAIEVPPLALGLPPSVDLGDFTFGVFPLAKPLRKPPPVIAKELKEELDRSLPGSKLSRIDAVGPYLNLTVEPAVLFEALCESIRDAEQPFGLSRAHAGKRAMVEFSSPNTNKPLHLGHIRNCVLGDASSHLLQAVGYEVIRACLVNDRGIQICQSMLAYQKSFAGRTPASRNQKGDHLVGDCYVAFSQALKKEKAELRARLTEEGLKDEALEQRIDAESVLLRESRELLRRWEAGDPDVRALWRQMNDWVLEGHNETYRRLGIAFDRFYFESELYTKGRQMVLDALERGQVQRREDGSVFIDLSAEGLDTKVLLRRDGTSLYITQDLGVAQQKWADYQPERSIYVIANEQDHQMRVLFEILKKLGFPGAAGLYHLSYGMVNLPEGRMKSREGNVVDADDLLDEMFTKARETAAEKNQLRQSDEGGEAPSELELEARARAVTLGAIKFFMLKTNPRKDFVFNPEESVDFQGDTGPYVQYTHARIRSILRKGAARGVTVTATRTLETYRPLGNPEERSLARVLSDFPRVVSEAAEKLLPSSIATYLLDLAAAFNRFYHHHSVLGAPEPEVVLARLALTEATGIVLARGLNLLGIEAPDAM